MEAKIEPKNYTGKLARLVAGSFRASNDRIEKLEAENVKMLDVLRLAQIGIKDQWQRDGAVGTPLRDASVAIDDILSNVEARGHGQGGLRGPE